LTEESEVTGSNSSRAEAIPRRVWLLEVEAEGAALAAFAPDASPTLPAADEEMPDIVELFAACAASGMFSGPGSDPTASAGVVVDASADPVARAKSWQLRLEGVDPGGFRVLRNLLEARGLDSFAIRPIGGDPGDFPDLEARLDYPGTWPRPRFGIHHERPHRPSQDRALRLVLASEPDDYALEGIYRDLDRWANLIVLGGYAPDGFDPARSGALPDLAYLHDPVTVEQGFGEAFIADEDAFNAAFNWAVRLDASGVQVREVVVR
jgi:hypothetical protein